MHAIGGHPEVPAPCCVPDVLSSLTLLYFDDNRNVVLKNYPSMTAESCACRWIKSQKEKRSQTFWGIHRNKTQSLVDPCSSQSARTNQHNLVKMDTTNKSNTRQDKLHIPPSTHPIENLLRAANQQKLLYREIETIQWKSNVFFFNFNSIFFLSCITISLPIFFCRRRRRHLELIDFYPPEV